MLHRDTRQSLRVGNVFQERLTRVQPQFARHPSPHRSFTATANICSKTLLCSVEQSKEHERTQQFNAFSVRSFSHDFRNLRDVISFLSLPKIFDMLIPFNNAEVINGK